MDDRTRRGIVVVAGGEARALRAMLADLRGAGFLAIGYQDPRGALAHLALGERADALVMDAGFAEAVEGLAREAAAGRRGMPVIYVCDRCPDAGAMVPDGSFVARPPRSGDLPAAVAARLGLPAVGAARAA